jgi:hypothetical protein
MRIVTIKQPWGWRDYLIDDGGALMDLQLIRDLIARESDLWQKLRERAKHRHVLQMQGNTIRHVSVRSASSEERFSEK